MSEEVVPDRRRRPKRVVSWWHHRLGDVPNAIKRTKNELRATGRDSLPTIALFYRQFTEHSKAMFPILPYAIFWSVATHIVTG